jgi:hypothetical protein
MRPSFKAHLNIARGVFNKLRWANGVLTLPLTIRWRSSRVSNIVRRPLLSVPNSGRCLVFYRQMSLKGSGDIAV